MGRQAYLTRLAFGRSAYEPPEHAQQVEPSAHPEPQSDGVVVMGSSNMLPEAPEVPEAPEALEAPEAEATNLYAPPEQQYNDRGRPVNPQSRAFARELRAAQNDVLAAVGVCIRNNPPEEDPRSSKQDDEALLEEDELWSSIISLSGVIVKQTSVWWVGALRDRIMAYRINPGISFTQVLSSDLRHAGLAAFFFAGTPLYYSTIFLLDEEEWVTMLLDYASRFILATVPSREERLAWEERLARIRPVILFLFEVLTAPALLHMTLQGLHLSQNNLFIPPWRAFIPFTEWSPVQPVWPTSFTAAGLGSWTSALAESPVLMIWLYRHTLGDLHGWLFHALRTRILRPINIESLPNGADSDAGDYTEFQTLNSRLSSSTLPLLDRALSFLGWGTPRTIQPRPAPINRSRSHRHSISIPPPAEEPVNTSPSTLQPTQTDIQPDERLTSQTADESAEDARLDDDRRPQDATGERLADVSSGNHPQDAQDGAVNIEAPGHPLSPISTVADDLVDPPDASIRIASSEVETGAVSLEIALPDERLSQVVGESSQSQERENTPHGMGRISHPDQIESRATYNVSDLSIEPAEMLSYVLADCLASWVLLPARMCIIYRLAEQFARPGHRELRLPFVSVINKSQLTLPGIKALPVIVGRVALCCALEGLICAAFWSIECGVVVTVGKKWFGWNKKARMRSGGGNV